MTMSKLLDFSWNSRGDELARINADGTTTYNWGLIAQHAATWEPGSTDIGACLAKLLLPLMPDVPEAAFGNTAATTRRELQDRGEHPAPCQRQCEAQALQIEIARLQANLNEEQELRERMRDILRRVAVTLRGPEPELTRWSWHDLPERAAAAVAAIDVMRRTAQMVAEAAQEPADVLAEYRGEGASQWVKVRAWLRPGERIVRVGGGDE
jgi:hypothetical protein